MMTVTQKINSSMARVYDCVCVCMSVSFNGGVCFRHSVWQKTKYHELDKDSC